MSVANRDSSYITQLRQSGTLKAFYNQNKQDQNAGLTIRHEQTSVQSGQVVTERRDGPSLCASCGINNIYTFPPTDPNGAS